MNRKISLLVTAALGFSLAGFPAYAQSQQHKGTKTTQNHRRGGDKNRTRQRRPRVSMEQRFAKELNLTAAQQKKINPIFKKQGEQLRSIRANKKLTREQKRQQSQKIYAALPGQINKHLNKTQQAKLKQMTERRKNYQGRRRGANGKRHQSKPVKKK